MASRATKLFLLVLSLGHAQYIYQQYIPQRPVVSFTVISKILAHIFLSRCAESIEARLVLSI